MPPSSIHNIIPVAANIHQDILRSQIERLQVIDNGTNTFIVRLSGSLHSLNIVLATKNQGRAIASIQLDTLPVSGTVILEARQLNTNRILADALMVSMMQGLDFWTVDEQSPWHDKDMRLWTQVDRGLLFERY